MSSILYYSNYCDKCKNILRAIGNSEIKSDIHFICIDKRFRDPNTGGIYAILENQQKILLPPQIQKVPAMLLIKEGNRVIFGSEIVLVESPDKLSVVFLNFTILTFPSFSICLNACSNCGPQSHLQLPNISPVIHEE